jgi:outer membrane protein TolC
MIRKLKIAGALLCSILFMTKGLHAQESLVPDINYQFLEKLIATAKKNYPEVKLRQSQVNIAKSAVSQASMSWLDAFTASYIYSPKSSLNLIQPTIFNGYQLSISINLGQYLTKPFAVRSAKESVKVAQYQQQEYNLSIESTVKKLYYQYLAAQAELRLRSGAIIDGETAVKQLKYAFQKGEATFQVYNEALTSLYQQGGFKVQAELATLTAKTNLEEVLGVKLEEVK